MTYNLGFLDAALKEWRKLNPTIRDMFKAKLKHRLEMPHVVSARLNGKPNRYKIKLHDVGYRLIYEVREDEILVLVIAVGRRDHDEVYDKANQR